MTEYLDGTAVRSPGILAAAWRYRLSSAFIVLLGLLLGIAYAVLTVPEPSAEARLTLLDPRGNNVFRQGNSSSVDLTRYTTERALFARSDVVLQRAIATLGTSIAVEDLREDITTKPDVGASILAVRATAGTSRQAAARANAIATAYRDASAEDIQAKQAAALAAIDVERQRILAGGTLGGPAGASASDTLTQLDVRATDIRVNGALFASGVANIDPAEIDPPPAPQLLRFGVLGLLFGVLAALALAWTRADRSPSVDWGIDVVSVLGAPLLGEVQELSPRDTPALLELASAPHQAYEWVTASVRSRAPGGVLLITSGLRGEGSTTTTLQLAASAARDGRKVCVLDLDPEAPDGVTALLGLGQAPGIADHLGGRELQARSIGGGAGTRFDVVPVGSQRGLLRTAGARREALADAMAGLRDRYDVLLLDAPPLLSSPAAVDLLGLADQVVLVVERGIPIDELIAVRNLLASVGPAVLGAVFTKVPATGGAASGPAAAGAAAATTPPARRQLVT